MRKIILVLVLILLTTIMLSACGVNSPNIELSLVDFSMTGDEFSEIVENPFVNPVDNPNSTFSLAVNTAGYSLLRRYINETKPINANMVKIEDVVNYFKYDYPNPAENEPVSLTASLFACPWNSEANLLTVGVKAQELEVENINNNLVFLIDVSGSMNHTDKLALVQDSMIKILENLDENDKISIVTYSGKEEILLRGADGSQKTEITTIINSLKASGSTNGQSAIQTAYSLAQDYFITGGNNRVILATDGDFNVGISDPEELRAFISKKRESGVYLTALGFGTGNLQDSNMTALANSGNGNYAYIDSVDEANRVLVEEIGGTLYTCAKDAKIKVEFNPAKVARYRLLGYENSLLSMAEYQDSATDAGEIGSGFTVTAVYEIVLADNPDATSTMENNFLNVEMRYKSPSAEDETEHALNVYADADSIYQTPTEDQLFISALVETCLILRNSEYKGTSSLNNVNERLKDLPKVASNKYRAEFKELVEALIERYSYGE